jgi:hypothetical protein
MQENGFDAEDILVHLTDQQIEEMMHVVGIEKMGHRFHFLNKLNELKAEYAFPPSGVPVGYQAAVQPAQHRHPPNALIPPGASVSREPLAVGGGAGVGSSASNSSSKLPQTIGSSRARPKKMPLLQSGANAVDREFEAMGATGEAPPTVQSHLIDGEIAAPKDVPHHPHGERGATLFNQNWQQGQTNSAPGAPAGNGRKQQGGGSGYLPPGYANRPRPKSPVVSQRGDSHANTIFPSASQVRGQSTGVNHSIGRVEGYAEDTSKNVGLVTTNSAGDVEKLHNAAPYKKLLQMLRETASGSPAATSPRRRGTSPGASSPTLMQRNSTARLFLQ